MLSSTKVVVAAVSIALPLGLGTGVASAQPDVTAVVNTTCTYDQVIAALNANSPGDAAQFTSSPVAVGWLHSFLGAPRDQRQQMIQQVQSIPAAGPYTGLVLQVANTCNRY
ncbi:hemophore-related protein [Mycobacterium sp. 3519A]|jgi:hemophore-related protein|uniref:hemophore-related protein n=1 Tax=Mycobacterium sp. 3519A TaxID=2057184 RepID=UPI000C7979FA|nr:hemophore-related protein [Mycobacterium sp. 3519A]